MHTLKRAVIILALLIPFSLIFLPTATLPSLFSIQPAEAYTYQDVENAYNKAKQDYPNDYIFIEEFNQDGKKGYKIWRRPRPGPVVSIEGYWVGGIKKGGCIGWGCSRGVNSCEGKYEGIFVPEGGIWYEYTGNEDHIKYCDGTTKIIREEWGRVSNSGISQECNYATHIYNVNCAANDVLLATFFPIEECTDNDGDGYYANDSVSCPEGNDCNDNDPSINPATIWYKDVDGDGYSDGSTTTSCQRPDGYKLASELKATSGDCDDNNASKNPEDKDGDGYGGCEDCKDTDPAIYPGAKEKCDGKDNNCNEEIDEGACDCSVELNLSSSANAANGSLSHSQTLFQTPNSKLLSDFTLFYNSLYSISGHLGTGWSHSYDITLKEFTNGSILFREGNNRRLYTLSGSNYVNQAGDYSTLVKNPDGTYLLTKKDGTKYTFDTGGKLTKIEDRLANTMTFVYTGNNLTEITDSVGRRTTLSYDSNNRIISITDHTSTLTSTLTYDLSGYLTAVTDTAGYSWTYTYDANGRMLTKSDTEGNVITYAYDSSGRVISSTDSAGQSKTISYTSPLGGEGGVRGEATVTETNGGEWTYTYDSANGTLTQKTDPQGNTTTYQYDNSRNLTKETAPDGSITTYTYDTSGNMTSQTDASGNSTSYTYNTYGQATSIKDPQNNVINYSYDTYGNLTSVTDLSGGITQFNYDSKGNITRITSPNGGVTVYEYDSYNNIISITDPSGAITKFTYDTSGNMTSITDTSGNTTRFEYNNLNQLIRVIDSSGNATEYSYDSRGNKTSQTDANGNTTFYEYNHNSKLTKVTDALGNATNYTYGGAGGCQSCGSGGGDNLTSITDAKGQVTIYQYDTLGRLTKEIDPLGNSITYSYDSKGNLTQKTDANGAIINYTYDSLGRLLKKKYPDNTEESFTYDSKGNILTATNQNISYTFTYDASGKPLSVTDSYGRTIKYEYDTAGNKVKMTTPEGKEIKYTYDISHRLTQINADSVIASETKQSQMQTFSFAYDTAGRRTKLTYPNGVTTNYTYDSIGRLTNLLTQYTELQSQGKKKPPILKLHTIDSFTYTHDKVGNRLTKTEISDTYTNTDKYSYDAIYRLTQALPTKLQGKDKEHDNKADNFSYDAVGNRLTGAKTKDTYSYDQGNQLTNDRKHNYEYDKNGNLIKKTEIDDNEKTKTWTYYYDYENKLIMVVKQGEDETKTISFKYDSFGRRIEKKVTETPSTLAGEGEGKGEAKTYNYVYDNEDIILEYLTKAEDGKIKTETTRYTHGLGIDEPLAIERKGEIYYYHADGLGSITSLTDKKQKVVESYTYSSFGELKRHGDKVKNTYTYTGREWDKEIGLYYYRARYYDAKVGRFIGKDPILNPLNPMAIGLSRSANLIVWMAPYLISSPKSLHPYVYVGNAPTVYTDSTGLLGWDTVIKQVLKQLAKRLLKEWTGDPIEKGAEEERKALGQFYFEQYKRCLEGCGGEGRCDTEECKEKCSEQYTRDMERLQRAFR